MKSWCNVSLLRHFEAVEDPRIERSKKHLLSDILSLAICAVIGGADGWEEIEDFGHDKHDWLKRFLRLPNGIPSHDTISRVFRRIDPQMFQDCFLRWTSALCENLGLRQVCIDGKTLRRSHDRNSAQRALHLVSAWSVENRLTLGQERVDEKSNEITAIPELLKLLDLQGALVTLDAMGCQKHIAKQITQQGGDYVLAVKDNQPTLHAAVEKHFLHLHETDFEGSGARRQRTQETAHGRQEDRYYTIAPLPHSLRQRGEEWTGIQSLGQVISITRREGKEVSDVRYYISSLPPRVKKFAASVRDHWKIENSLHWVLDVTFDEDRSRIRKDHGPENFALLRRIANSVIQRDTSRKQSVKRARKRAGWNNQNLLDLLSKAT